MFERLTKIKMASDDEKRDAKRCCLVLLCGLPGAGKTTFAKKFAEHLKRQENSCSVVHVCYDDLISRARQAEMAKEASSRDDDEKRYHDNNDIFD